MRHIYDLHMMRERLYVAAVTAFARDIADDALQYAHQHPAYKADVPSETRTALDAFRADPLHHQQRYEAFLTEMVYGERPIARRNIHPLGNMHRYGAGDKSRLQNRHLFLVRPVPHPAPAGDDIDFWHIPPQS